MPLSATGAEILAWIARLINEGLRRRSHIAPMSTTSKRICKTRADGALGPCRRPSWSVRHPPALVARCLPGLRFFFTAISDNVGIDRGKLHRGQQPGAIASSAPRY